MLSRLARPCYQVCNNSSHSNKHLLNQAKSWIANKGQSTIAATVTKEAALGLAAKEGATTTSRVVGWWMAGCAGMCVGAVVLGGVTRLTESGLSMTDWQLLGRPPPSTDEAWNIEFEKYKLSPEFKYKNFDITMNEFKFIWYMEYGHRMWGRTIGAVFFLPAAAMWAKGMFNTAVKKRVVLAGGLLMFQGLLGWYMVKSGLDHDNFLGPNDVPRVSQYRLAAHLSSAVVLYSVLFWGAKGILKPAIQFDPSKITPQLAKFRKLAITSKAAAFITLVSGAFVAGLDAGLVYNSFPKFADRWIPEDILLQTPVLRNITENPTTVQFNHRILGTTTLAILTATAIQAQRLPLPPRIKTAALLMGGMGWMQVALGISTLLLYVPVPVAAAHQSGALATLSLAMWLSHESKFLKLARKLPK
jgi:cytochrome c oxidase assembly protein subunit 15